MWIFAIYLNTREICQLCSRKIKIIYIANVDVIDISYDIDRTYFYWCFNMVATCNMALPSCKQFLQLVPNLWRILLEFSIFASILTKIKNLNKVHNIYYVWRGINACTILRYEMLLRGFTSVETHVWLTQDEGRWKCLHAYDELVYLCILRI